MAQYDKVFAYTERPRIQMQGVLHVSHHSHVIHMGLVGHFRLNDVQDAKMIVAQTFSKFNVVASFGVTNEDRETFEPLYTKP